MKSRVARALWAEFNRRFPRAACDLNFLRRYHNFEADLWPIPRFCRHDSGAIDVGANMGIYSRWIAKHSCRVESFECNPLLLEHLKRFLPRNVTLHGCALSSHAGSANLRYDPDNTGIGTIERNNLLDKNPGIQAVDAVVVEVRRLDDFNLPTVTFMKIDVEGHELSVLEGAAGLLSLNRPALLIEIEERHCPGNLQAVPRLLKRWGYSPHRLVGSEIVPVASMDDAAASGSNNFWFLAS